MKQFLAYGALVGWCVALVAARMLRAHSHAFLFLVWNLILGVIPLGASLLLDALHRRRAHVALQAFPFAVWLAFLPNAPYLVTDLVHLAPRDPVPFWFDTLLLGSCAVTGLLLGYASVAIVQRVVAARFRALGGWTVAIGALVLSAFGMYLGRFVRWNSWEIVTNPRPLFVDVAHRLLNPQQHPRTYLVTALFGVTLVLGYLAVHAVADTLSRTRA
ncbi:MAG TPA: DUF1361 domain-containing protein [Thermoanaerobaculia bacterium]|jgi:uncharacterized membrane protein